MDKTDKNDSKNESGSKSKNANTTEDKNKIEDKNKNENNDRYKDTLNLPFTAFPMKANLPEREPLILKKWEALEIYKTLLQKNASKPKFILPDGPPFANGDIHLGHALNKILKDIILKSKMLSGWNAPFVPGWDCHGLPIEHNVEKVVGKAGVKVDAKTFREKCREYVEKQIESQRNSFIRLGVFGDWQHPYKTMDYQYEADIIRSLSKIIQKGHVHKGYKPVHWCVECGSALAEAEVEYADKTSPSIYVRFRVDNIDDLPFSDKEKNVANKPISFAVWTTTPWTLPANEAVALHPDHDYVLIEGEKELIIMVAERYETVIRKIFHVETFTSRGSRKGRDFANVFVKHPFYDKVVPIVLGEHVTLEDGTGCVHTAPAHGQEDYMVGLKYHLPLDNPVGPNGCFISTTPLFAGEHVFKANEKIIEELKKHHNLMHAETIVHSYPHCWRHKTPIIFRATQQWFIGMEQKGLRKKTLEAIKKVQWLPSWGQARITGMIEQRPDWCISRQRTWGVPLSLFIHKETGSLHPETPKLMEEVAKRVEKGGIEAWFELNKEELLTKEDAAVYEKTPDTIDVWFDSGTAHFCVLQKRSELQFPADLYLEGSDQHRGWFQSSLLTSVAMYDEPPYRQVLTHGFTVDPQGRKMSKSLGNVVAPEKVVNTLGADVLRLWVAATDYRSEMTVSDEILKRTSEAYRRIRNTARFLLANLNGFDPVLHSVPAEKMLALDAWIVNRAKALQEDIIKSYHEYQFHNIYQKIHNFCSVELGSFYLDVIKDRQYTGKKEGIPRRSAQTALYHIAQALVRWISPILTFTAEEIWENLPGIPEGREPSVLFSEWYKDFPRFKEGNELIKDDFWQKILEVRNVVNKALEEARNQGLMGSSLEAEVTLYCELPLYELLSKLQEELRFVLITSKAKVLPEKERNAQALATGIQGVWLEVKPSTNLKCVRCWHRVEDVDQYPNTPGICGRCVENIGAIGEVRQYA